MNGDLCAGQGRGAQDFTQELVPEERRRVVLVAKGVRRDFEPSPEALQPVDFPQPPVPPHDGESMAEIWGWIG